MTMEALVLWTKVRNQSLNPKKPDSPKRLRGAEEILSLKGHSQVTPKTGGHVTGKLWAPL